MIVKSSAPCLTAVFIGFAAGMLSARAGEPAPLRPIGTIGKGERVLGGGRELPPATRYTTYVWVYQW